MVVAEEEAGFFAGIAGGVLINIGTPYPSRLRAMHASADAARAAGRPWVLDPVAAGGIPWRDGIIREFVEKSRRSFAATPAKSLLLRGESGGKGVQQMVVPMRPGCRWSLAGSSGSIVVVTGETDYVTDGVRTLRVTGGDPMATLVVGTGCSLSALVAAFCAVSDDRLTASATACALAKKAAEAARPKVRRPRTFTILTGSIYQVAHFTSAE